MTTATKPISSYANHSDPLLGGGSAVAAEKSAQWMAEQYNDGVSYNDPVTGQFDPNRLPENIKEEIRSIGSAVASVVGASGGNGSSFNAQVAGVIGQNAVENNSLLGDDIQKYIAERAQRAAQAARER